MRIGAMNSMDNFMSHIRQKTVHLGIMVHGEDSTKSFAL